MNNIEVKTEGKLAWIKLKYEKSLNAFSSNLLREFKEKLLEMESSDNVQVVIISGTGKSFIAGADIKEMQDMSPKEAFDYASATCELYTIIENSSKCYIAMLNGYTFGAGTEFALACDLRIASSKASFMLPEVSLGIIPGGGGTQKLMRIIGEGRAKEMIFLGDRIDADTAYRYGLLTEVAPPEELEERTEALAGKVLRNSPVGIAMAKKAINKGRNMGLEEGLIFERQAFALCFSEDDQKKLMKAFANKSK